MRVLLFSQYYPPEVGATQNRMHAFATHLASVGHDVSVVAHVPNHPKGEIFPDYRGTLLDRRDEDGVDVIRVWVHTSTEKSSLRRLTFYFSYAFNALLATGICLHRRPDVVFATSPPLPVLLPAAAVAAAARRPFVADIRDLWPAVAVSMGELSDGRVLRLAERLERWLYRRATRITAVTRSFVDHVERNGGHDKVVHLPNGTDDEVFTDAAADPYLRHELGLEKTFTVGYFGNHGIAQGLEALVDAAAMLDDRDDVTFLLVGEGPVKADLVQRATEAGADNIRFLPQVPTDEAPRWISACDVLVVPLADRELLRRFVPSKLFDFLACGKPVVLMADGEARVILEESQGGWYVESENAGQLAALVRKLADDPFQLAGVGSTGQAYVRRHYTRRRQAEQLAELLEGVAAPDPTVGDQAPEKTTRAGEDNSPAKVRRPVADMLEHSLLLARTVRHLRAAQVAHRLRLRTQKRGFARWGPALDARWRREAPTTRGWPEDFAPLDAREARGYPDAETNAAGSFWLRNETRWLGDPPDWAQTEAPHLWRYDLHAFEWAWSFAAHPDRAWAGSAFLELWRSWRETTPMGRADAWAPYPASLRAWALCGLYAPLVADTAEEEDFVADLTVHARYLRANLEFDVGGNHLIKNLKALAGLGVFLGDDQLTRFALRHLYRQVGLQVLDDGGHFERSPSYHCQVLGDLIDVDALLGAAGCPAGGWLADAVAAMRAWLGAMRLPDGGIPLFNDAAPVTQERLTLLQPTSPPPDRLVVLQPSGYLICRPDGRLHLVADVGPPCPAELPAHAHADCLSFELAVDGQRVVTDTGTSTYEAGPERAYERSTAAHNTVVVDGENQTEVWGRFRAARRAQATLHEATEDSDGVRVRASHDGYRRLPGRPRHQRTWHCAPGKLTIVDEVDADASVEASARLHLAPGLTASTEDGAMQAGPLRMTAEAQLEAHSEGTEWAADGFGIRLPKQVLEVRGRGRRIKLVTHLTTDTATPAQTAPEEG